MDIEQSEEDVLVTEGTQRNRTAMSRLFSSPLAGLGLAFAVLVVVIFSIAPNTLVPSNLLNLLLTSVPLALVSFGVVFPMLAGQLDLSVGAMMGVSAMVGTNCITVWNLPPFLALIAPVAAGALLGLVNGALVAGLGLPSVLVTLATFTAFPGITRLISSKRTLEVTPISDPTYLGVSTRGILGVPISVLIVIIVAALAYYIIHRSWFGLSLLAAGGNPISALRSGVRVPRTVVVVYVASGVCAGLAGLVISSQLTTTTESTGLGMEFLAITAVVVGGVSLFGGVGTVGGAVLGVAFVALLASGLRFAGAGPEIGSGLTGVTLIAAIVIDIRWRSARGHRRSSQ